MRRPQKKESRPVRELDIPDPDPAIEQVDGAIKRAISSMPGCPAVNVIGAVSQEFHRQGILSEPLSHNIIPLRLEELCKSGDITRLRAVSGSGDTEDNVYYPQGWKFETTPRTQFLGAYKEPKGLSGILDPESQAAQDALMTLLSMEDKRVVLRIISKFCYRCGELKDGHFCND